ncbi:hypothetical protein D3C81_848980 [compost metagenome]
MDWGASAADIVWIFCRPFVVRACTGSGLSGLGAEFIQFHGRYRRACQCRSDLRLLGRSSAVRDSRNEREYLVAGNSCLCGGRVPCLELSPSEDFHGGCGKRLPRYRAWAYGVASGMGFSTVFLELVDFSGHFCR